MADKQAFVYIVDQGLSMGDYHNGRIESDLDFGMRYIWDKIATTLAASRKTFTIGVVGLKTEDSNNILSDDEAYHHISIQQPLGPMSMSQLKALQDSIKVSSTESGDALSAIVIAIEMISSFTRRLKYSRKIFLLTNGYGSIDDDGTNEIVQKLNEDDIELAIIGIDFDDPEYGFKEEDKDSQKSRNEALLKNLTERCKSSVYATALEAVDSISVPKVKESRPYASFKGQLTLGDPEKYETAMSIDVERYFRTKVANPPSASSFVISATATNGSAQSSHTLDNLGDVDMDEAPTRENGLTSLRSTRTYKVKDETGPGGKRDVNPEELAKGYEYGQTAVYISESDLNVTKLETKKSFSIMGFVPSEKYERYFNMGSSEVTVASSVNDKARLAMSSFIHALHELDSYAIARLVLKDDKDPKLLLLAPSIEAHLECLIDVPLPFAEDFRQYRFPPLDRVVTVTGATLTKHRNIPTDTLTKAMDEFVDKMDLSEFDTAEEGVATEYMPIEDTYSVVLHRINQAVRRRATQPDEPIPPVPEILMKYSRPPTKLVTSAKTDLERLIAISDVKKVPPKVRGRRTGREPIQPQSGLDIDALLSRQRRSEVTLENAIPEFKQILDHAETTSVVQNATQQMGSVIRSLISQSTGENGYARALENLRVMRQSLVQLEEWALFNNFIRDLKARLMKGELGGDRRLFMLEIKRARLGLIDQVLLEHSDVSEEEAVEFFTAQSEIPFRNG